MRDVYAATHWAVQGRPPAYHTPDEDVYLPGRNIILFGKAGVYCAAAHLDRLVLGTLAHNPFPDATPAFRAAMAHALSLGLAHQLRIAPPYCATSQAEVVPPRLSLGLPARTDALSCMNPPKSVIPAPTAACAASAGSGTTYSWSCRVADPTAYASTANLGLNGPEKFHRSPLTDQPYAYCALRTAPPSYLQPLWA